MLKGIAGRTAIVTGAAGGIGSATVRRLHAEGANVVAVDLDQAGVEALAAELGERVLPVRRRRDECRGHRALLQGGRRHVRVGRHVPRQRRRREQRRPGRRVRPRRLREGVRRQRAQRLPRLGRGRPADDDAAGSREDRLHRLDRRAQGRPGRVRLRGQQARGHRPGPLAHEGDRAARHPGQRGRPGPGGDADDAPARGGPGRAGRPRRRVVPGRPQHGDPAGAVRGGGRDRGDGRLAAERRGARTCTARSSPSAAGLYP